MPIKSPAEGKNSGTSLKVFGVLEIILGAICGLFGVFMVLGVLAFGTPAAPGTPATDARTGLIAAAVYLAGAALFIALGVGVFMGRRWSRTLNLSLGWPWLVLGVMGLAFFAYYMKDFFDLNPQAAQMPEGLLMVMKVFTLVFMGVFYVVIPGAIVLFFTRPSVKATVEALDSRERWTEACPLPPFILSQFYILAALGILCVPLLYSPAFPFFGLILTGLPAWGVYLALVAVFSVLAWGTFKLRPWAWWSGMGLVLAAGISGAITFSRHNLAEFYMAMNMPPQALEMIGKMPVLEKNMMLWQVAWMVLALGFIAAVRPYFYAKKSGKR